MKVTLSLRATPVSATPKVARTRPLPFRKSLLFDHHSHLLSSSPLVLFLRPGDFAASEWRQLRQQLAAVPTPPPSASSSPSSSSTPADQPPSGLRLTLLRPGLLPALLRTTDASLPLDTTHLSLPSHLKGPLAVLTSPDLHPPTLSAVLALVSKFSRLPAPNAPPLPAGQPPLERLSLLSSLVEHQSADAEKTLKVGQLPPLDVLRAQIVGLLSAPGSRITGVLGARAGELARTLEGFKLGLEEAAGGEKKQPESS